MKTNYKKSYRYSCNILKQSFKTRNNNIYIFLLKIEYN